MGLTLSRLSAYCYKNIILQVYLFCVIYIYYKYIYVAMPCQEQLAFVTGGNYTMHIK